MILLPTGAYDIEDINDEIIEQIEGITGKDNKRSIPDEPDKSPIEIHAKETLLGASIEIDNPNYSVDIYNSTIRTLLGWPEYPPDTVDIADLPLDPQRDNYSDEQSYLEAYNKWLNSLPAIHNKLPEPKFYDDFHTYELPKPSVRMLGKFEFLLRDDISDITTVHVQDGHEKSKTDRDHFNQFGKLLYDIELKPNEKSKISIDRIRNYFDERKRQFQDKLSLLRETLQRSLLLDMTSTKSSILQQQRELNQIIDDVNFVNDKFLSLIDSGKSANAREKFQKIFSLNDNTIKTYKFPGWCAPELTLSTWNLLNIYFPQIHKLWEEIYPKFPTLTSNNTPYKTGKHRSPNSVNITDVIAIHVIADVIQDSYFVDASSSSRANSGYILYTFSPNVSPGSLIVMNPPNLVYLATVHDSIARINFRITDQDFSLLDLRGEQLQMTIEVKS